MISPSYSLTATERVLPRLALDFTTAVLDPRVTFTRATTATFTGSDGLIQTAAIDAPRFDYNPTTLTPLGLLIEEQRTNTTNYSEQFNNAWWSKTRATATADVIVSPDGTVGADKLVEDTTASNTHYITTTQYSTVSGTSYTWSVYLKAAERTKVRVALQMFFSGSAYPTTNPRVDVDLTTGTLSGANGTIATSITNAGNGWYRVTVSATANASASDQRAGFYLLDGAGNQSYTGNGVSGLYIWGAQLEAGAFPTSYIPTVASQVTRSADVAVMTGTNFSSWYNASEGAFVAGVNLNVLVTPAVKPVFAAYDGTFNSNRVYLNVGISGQTNLLVNSGGSSQANILGPILTANNLMKVSSKYKVNDFALTANGITPSTDTSGVVPVGSNKLDIGSFQPASAYLNGHVAFLNYYPLALTNNEVQAFSK